MSDALSDLLAKLDSVRKSGDGWSARCPAHEDRKASLSVAANNNKILVHCHAGCAVESICHVIGIKTNDLDLDNHQGSLARPHATANSKPNGSARLQPFKGTEADVERMQCDLLKNCQVQAYVESRGILLRVATDLKWGSVRWRFWNEQDDWVEKTALAVPHYCAGKLVGIKFKTIDGTKLFSQMSGSSTDGLYALAHLDPNAADVLILEGPEDAALAISHGFNAVAINAADASLLADDIAALCRHPRLFVLGDQDVPGQRAMDMLQQRLLPERAIRVHMPSYKDIGELYRANPTTFAAELGSVLHLTWCEVFHSFSDFENAPPLSFAIRDFLQNDGATLIGGLSGHGKTFLLLSVVKALLMGAGSKLWGHFEVLETASRVIYLIPESAIGPFKHRLKLFGLYDYVRDDRLLVRTLSKGPTPYLSDPRILFAAKDAHVILDTAVRFAEGEENSSGDNQRGLASDIFALLGAGARTVAGAHHSPKPFARENVMRLENVLRGSGDIGAMLTTAWGIKQLDAERNIVHIENVKSRDFQPPPPFQLIGRPHIDTEGDFQMHRRPGECGSLQDEQEPERDKGGASIQAREARAANIALLQKWLEEDPDQTSDQLVRQFANLSIKVSSSTVRKYKMKLEK